MGDYIDIDYVQKITGRTFDSTTEPTSTQIEHFINLAEKEFEREFGSYLETTTVEQIEAVRDCLYVTNLPITSITYIKTTDNHPTNPQVLDTLNSTDYMIKYEDTGKVMVLNAYPGRLYEISYVSGYTELTLPDNVKYLIFLMTMKYVFNATITNSDGNFGNSQVIIDVDVYKEITGKSYYTDSLDTIDKLINNTKASINKKMRTIWVH